MTTLNLSTVVPGEATQIVSRRATCQGIQYTIADILGVHTVTVHNSCIGCSCGLDCSFLTSEHMRIVEAQEAAYAEEAARRAAYTEVFDIYSWSHPGLLACSGDQRQERTTIMQTTCEQETSVAAKVSDKLPQLGIEAWETCYLAWDHRGLRLFVVQWVLTRWTCTCGQHGCAHRLAAHQYVFEQTMKKNTYEKRCFLLAATHPGKQETSQKKGGEPRCS